MSIKMHILINITNINCKRSCKKLLCEGYKISRNITEGFVGSYLSSGDRQYRGRFQSAKKLADCPSSFS